MATNSGRVPKTAKYLILVALIVVIVAVAVILLLEFNPSTTSEEKESSVTKSPPVEGNVEVSTKEVTTVSPYCSETKGMNEICDSVKDCVDGSDEVNCAMRNNSICDGFRCSKYTKDYQCLTQNLVCDGMKDCLDGSDETNCGDQCGVSEYRCLSLTKDTTSICVDQDRVCDHFPDCPGSTDEILCAKWSQWGPWCREQVGNLEPCFLHRQNQCEHARGGMINTTAECTEYGLGLESTDVNDVFPFCANVTGLDPYQVELCPRYRDLFLVNDTIMSKSRSLSADVPINRSGLSGIVARLRERVKNDNQRTAKSQMNDAPPLEARTSNETPNLRHVYAAIVGCLALIVSIGLLTAAYCVTHRYQYRAYYVAKKEREISVIANNNNDDDESKDEDRRVSTSSAV